MFHRQRELWRLYQFIPLLAVLLTSLATVVTGATTLASDEVEALKDIGAALGKKWNFSVDPCSGESGWSTATSDPIFKNNVTCGNCSIDAANNTICHVTNILLKAQSLPGTLPPDFTRLPYLQEIDLTRNYLNGTIPSAWGSLKNLVALSLLGNRLTGPIPKELGSITTLESLVLEFNQLSGSLPSELGNLPRLTRLFLTSNYFTGELPPSFANLTALQQVWLGDNQFNGTIPDFIQYWTNLTQLVIQASGFDGPIPSTIGALRKLEDLRISDLKGPEHSFPQLDTRSNLGKLILRSCNLTGPLPGYLENMTSLRTLDLSFNKLNGPIPTLPTRLNYLFLTGNMLTGSIPQSIMNSQANVDLSYNNFTDTNLKCQNGEMNLFASSSAASNSRIFSCVQSFCPERPYNLSINCGGTKVPVGSATYMEDAIQGTPSFSFESGSYWGFSTTGYFMDGTTTVSTNYIQKNQSILSANRDSQLYMDARSSPISLTYYGYCLRNGIYTVSLHFAEIVFTDGINYSSLGRRVFDIYIQGLKVREDFNIENEAGGVGIGIVRNFTATVTDGTLNIRFYWAGKGTISIPTKGVYGPLISAISVNPNFDPSKMEEPGGGSKLSAGAVVGIVASVVLAIFLIVGILWWKGCLGHKDSMDEDLKGLDLQTGSFTLRQIKAATNNFDHSNKIGEGGFGSVYKGLLSDGTIIAVKQLSAKSKQGNREFVNEIGMISALQHPHLVKLYGCCIEGNQLLLVYEYLENNSLARALFGPKEFQLNLNWRTRHRICVGIARGLAYLHEESRLKIVHRDIKATNVLLDKDLNPKISDFGLAKLDEEDNTHISTRIAGTFGYMAPEYALRGYLTDKADVYSFGIVALEIVSGRSNTSYRSKEDSFYLLDWAHVLQETGELMDLVDPRLGSDFDKDEVLGMIHVALLCTHVCPPVRPAMSAVVSMLEGKVRVPSSIPENMVRNDAKKIEAMRKHFKGEEEVIVGEKQSKSQTQSTYSDGPWTGSSASGSDLYPILNDSDYWRNWD